LNMAVTKPMMSLHILSVPENMRFQISGFFIHETMLPSSS